MHKSIRYVIYVQHLQELLTEFSFLLADFCNLTLADSVCSSSIEFILKHTSHFG